MNVSLDIIKEDYEFLDAYLYFYYDELLSLSPTGHRDIDVDIMVAIEHSMKRYFNGDTIEWRNIPSSFKISILYHYVEKKIARMTDEQREQIMNYFPKYILDKMNEICKRYIVYNHYVDLCDEIFIPIPDPITFLRLHEIYYKNYLHHIHF